MDRVSKSVRSKMMSNVKTKGTLPEIRVRKLLYSLGYRYRLNRKDLPGSPDIVLKKYNTAIFVHGCFWHKHDCKKGMAVPKTNTEFWVNKISKNKKRDEMNALALKELGWNLVTIWECETKCHRTLMKILSKNLPKNKTTH